MRTPDRRWEIGDVVTDRSKDRVYHIVHPARKKSQLVWLRQIHPPAIIRTITLAHPSSALMSRVEQTGQVEPEGFEF